MNYKNLLYKFNKDGYIVLKNIMNKNECNKLIKKTIIPILHKKNIYLSKPNTWKNKYGIKTDGNLIYGKNYGHIICKKNKHFRFSALFNNHKLNFFLNKIHCRRNIKKWNFNYLAKEGLGWIHLRYPYYKYKNIKLDNVKYPKDGFHLDGINNKNGINFNQSIILLPFITKVTKNSGGTAVIPGSHKLINDYILRHNYKTNNNVYDIINKIKNNNINNIIDIKGNKGDVLILHPHLVHSSSYADINSKVRITFNLSTQK